MKKIAIVVIGFIGVLLVCVIVAAVLLPTADVEETPEVVEVVPTQRPTARPEPTAVTYTADCKTLQEFEVVGAVVFDIAPDFGIGTDFDYEWMFLHDDGAYGISADVDSNGCVTTITALGVFDSLYGDYEMLGSLIGGMGAFFAEDASDDGLDWLYDDGNGVAYNCIDGGRHESHSTMKDGTDWYLLCEIDSDDFMNFGVRIDQ